MPSRFSQFKLAAFIALRIARSKRSSTLSLVTLISIIGIACGVMALTVVLAVTDGFQHAFQERILGIFPHVVVTRKTSSFSDYEPTLETIRATPGVAGATPLTGDEMMVANGPYRAGATVQGIDLPSVESVLDLAMLVRRDAGSQGRSPLEGLGETLDIAVTGTTRTLQKPVDGASLTVLQVGNDKPVVLVDERTSPDADRFRIKALDLRTTKGEIALVPESGAAVTVHDLVAPIVMQGGDIATATWGRELDVPSGTFILKPTDQRLVLARDRAYALILWEPSPGRVETKLLTEEADVVFRELTAAVRIVDLRTAADAGPIVWKGPDDIELSSTRPGELTGFMIVPARLPGVLLGQTLATKLQAKIGDALTFVTPLRGIDNKMVGPYGMLPSSTRFQLVGVFEAGFHDHDSRLALVNIAVAHRFMNRGKQIRSIAVRASVLGDLQATKSRLQRALDPMPLETIIERAYALDRKISAIVAPDSTDSNVPLRPPTADAPFISGLRNVYQVVNALRFSGVDAVTENDFQIFDWREKNINLFSALELQKIVLTIFFFIIILVGSFVVVGSQTMIVHEKTPDIAIIKAMGGTSGLVRLVFTLQGLFVAVIGLIAGLAVGLIMVAIIETVDYPLPASIYLIDHLPAAADAVELVLISLGTLVCTLLTTQISAGRAAAKMPVAGLRQVD